VELRFLLTQGLEPIFRTNDGSNCDRNINTSTFEGRRAACRLLLSKPGPLQDTAIRHHPAAIELQARDSPP
jgi:hypothetical protein